MIPVPPGSASRRRRGNGFTMSKLRKSIKPASMYFQFTGTAINAIIWPATSSITTNPGSLMPLSRATTVEGGIPISVTSTEIAIAVGIIQAEGISSPAAHQIAIVTAAAHVPEPGCKCPMPKKVAISQEVRERVGDKLLSKRALHKILQKGVFDSKFAKPLFVLKIFCVEDLAPAFPRCRHNQRVIPGQPITGMKL